MPDGAESYAFGGQPTFARVAANGPNEALVIGHHFLMLVAVAAKWFK